MSNIYLFSRQVDKDCELLEQEGIMDYSLLLGIYFKDISPDGEIIPLQSHTPTEKLRKQNGEYLFPLPEIPVTPAVLILSTELEVASLRSARFS
ncbi:hypothetical protein JHK84_053350 [Glycine max]|nr:hypothetical protein JHK85_054273 [Glycine max]KAG5083312.1 hypothetical protein JHK84_053350 [Glycine max]